MLVQEAPTGLGAVVSLPNYTTISTTHIPYIHNIHTERPYLSAFVIFICFLVHYNVNGRFYLGY